MRKKSVLVLIAILASVTLNFSQSSLTKVNLYSFFDTSEPDVYFESVFNDRSSLDFALNLGLGPFSTNIQAGYRWYLSSEWEAPNGIFVRPLIGFQSYEDDSEQENRYSGFRIGVTLGFQYVIAKHFPIDLFIGPAYLIGINENTESGFEMIFNVGAGYMF